MDALFLVFLRKYLTGDLEREFDECASNPCKVGNCGDSSTDSRITVDAFMCNCSMHSSFGMSGEECDVDLDECWSAPCQHNASCVDSKAHIAISATANM